MKKNLLWLCLLGLVLGLQAQAQAYMNFTITQPAPPVAAFSSSSNGLVTSFAGQNTGGITTWSWNFGDGGTSNLQNPTHTFATQGLQIICLTVGDQFGCTATDCDSILLVGIASPELLHGIALFPNPSNAETQVVYDLDQAADVKIEVLNLLGQSLKTVCDEPQNAGQHRLKLGMDLPAGVYLLRLRADDQQQVLRFTSAH